MFRRLTKTLFKTYGVVSETIRLSADQRIGPIETQTYKVRARLISYKLEQDGDFHIVIADVEDPGKTMIASGLFRLLARSNGRGAEWHRAASGIEDRTGI